MTYSNIKFLPNISQLSGLYVMHFLRTVAAKWGGTPFVWNQFLQLLAIWISRKSWVESEINLYFRKSRYVFSCFGEASPTTLEDPCFHPKQINPPHQWPYLNRLTSHPCPPPRRPVATGSSSIVLRFYSEEELASNIPFLEVPERGMRSAFSLYSIRLSPI